MLTKDQVIELVQLIDELRQPYNNSSRYHDLYLKATNTLNRLEDEGRIPINHRPDEFTSRISYGEAAYVAYCQSHDWHIGNLPLPKWHQLPEREQNAYEATARAVLRKRLEQSN